MESLKISRLNADAPIVTIHSIHERRRSNHPAYQAGSLHAVSSVPVVESVSPVSTVSTVSAAPVTSPVGPVGAAGPVGAVGAVSPVFLASASSVLIHLRESTSLPNWVLTRDSNDGQEVVASSARVEDVVGRIDLDLREYVSVLSAPVIDLVNGEQFGSLIGYVTERDVAGIESLSAVASAVRQRAATHQPLVELFATLLADSLSVERLRGR